MPGAPHLRSYPGVCDVIVSMCGGGGGVECRIEGLGVSVWWWWGGEGFECCIEGVV